MTTLYLARHGESLGQGLFLGASDPALSEEGRRQSLALADSLASAGVSLISCSRLRRSMETAEAVGERLCAPIEPDARWNEIGYGAWDGSSWEEIERRWPAQARAKLADWWGVTPEAGEKRCDFEARVTAAWRDLLRRGGAVLLVGHAGVNALVRELARGEPAVDWDQVTRFQQKYGEFLRLDAR